MPMHMSEARRSNATNCAGIGGQFKCSNKKGLDIQLIKIIVALVFGVACGWVGTMVSPSVSAPLFHVGQWGVTGTMILFVVGFYIAYKMAK